MLVGAGGNSYVPPTAFNQNNVGAGFTGSTVPPAYVVPPSIAAHTDNTGFGFVGSGPTLQNPSATGKHLKATNPWGGINTTPVVGKQAVPGNQASVLAKALAAVLSGRGGPGGSYTPVRALNVPVESFDFAGNQKAINSLSDAAETLGSQNLLSWLPTSIQAAAAQYDPQIAQTQQFGQQALNTIAAYNRGGEQLLNQVPGQINQDYRQVMSADRGMDQGIFNSLQAQNVRPALQGLGVDPGEAASLGRQADNIGLAASVLRGMGGMGIGNLNAERANQVASARQMAGGVQIAGGQAMAASEGATSTAITKLQSEETGQAYKTAGTLAGESSKQAGQLLSERGQDISSGNEAANRIKGENQFNASADQAAEKANQSAAQAAINGQTSYMQAATSRARLMLAIAKQNGAGTPAESATMAKNMNAFYETRAGNGPPNSVQHVQKIGPNGQPETNPNGSAVTTPVPVYNDKTTWTNMIQQGMVAFPGTSEIQAETMAGSHVNYGYGWDPKNLGAYDSDSRPLDYQWRVALQKAHLPTDIYLTNPNGQPFITRPMIKVIAEQPGGTNLTNHLRLSYNSKYGWVGYIPKIKG